VVVKSGKAGREPAEVDGPEEKHFSIIPNKRKKKTRRRSDGENIYNADESEKKELRQRKARRLGEEKKGSQKKEITLRQEEKGKERGEQRTGKGGGKERWKGGGARSRKAQKKNRGGRDKGGEKKTKR